MSLTDEALAPCPFCGLEYQGHFQWPGGAWSWYTVPDKHHNGCPLRGKSYATEAELVAAWNTRHSASPTDNDVGRDLSTELTEAANILHKHGDFDLRDAVRDARAALQAIRGTDEGLERLRKLSRDATAGEWFTDSENCDTGHGNVMALSIYSDGLLSYGEPAKLFDALNSDAMLVEHDDDEFGGHLFDRTSYANAEFIVACVNYVREALSKHQGNAPQEEKND